MNFQFEMPKISLAKLQFARGNSAILKCSSVLSYGERLLVPYLGGNLYHMRLMDYDSLEVFNFKLRKKEVCDPRKYYKKLIFMKKKMIVF